MRYGTPVKVRIGQPGKWRTIDVIYQFHTQDSQPAVVHWQTGMLLVSCIEPEDLPGDYQRQAQNAVDRKLGNITLGRFDDTIACHKVLNEVTP